jgi:hypothetical protein
MLRLVKTGAEGDGPRTDVMEITKPDDLTDIARLGDRAREGGLSLAEAKLLLAGVQREIVAAQARGHVLRRADCRCGRGVCRVKDDRKHLIAALFGQHTVRLGTATSSGVMRLRPFAGKDHCPAGSLPEVGTEFTL